MPGTEPNAEGWDGGAARPSTFPRVPYEPDLAEELEARDELLMACRDVLLGVGTKEAAALIAHIDALLDLDDEMTPGSQR